MYIGPRGFLLVISLTNLIDHIDGTTGAKDLEPGNGVALPEPFNLLVFFSHFIGAVEAVNFSAFRTGHPTFIVSIFQSAAFTFLYHGAFPFLRSSSFKLNLKKIDRFKFKI